MIVETAVGMAMAFLGWIVSITPDFGLNLDVDLAEWFETLGTYAARFSGYLPVAVVGASVAAVLIVQVVASAWSFIVWLYHQFWGSD